MSENKISAATSGFVGSSEVSEDLKNKKKLRRSIINERMNLDEELRRKYSELIVDEILLHYTRHVVCSYVAFRGEVNLERLHNTVLEKNGVLLLPYVEQETNSMSFYEVKSLDDLCISKMGIPEPNPNTCKVWSYEEIWESNPLVLTPGVAFTRCGNRMGYGGGFYDRFFETSRGRGTKLGICYRMQLRDVLPVEPHDIAVDHVIYAPKKVLLGLSGGVDSAVAAHLLKKAGYEVAGVHLRMWKMRDAGGEAADTFSQDEGLQFTLLTGEFEEIPEVMCEKSGTESAEKSGTESVQKSDKGSAAESNAEDRDIFLKKLSERYGLAPDAVDAYLVAKQMGIPLYCCDLRKEFREDVVEYFANEYLAGRTPNPCTYCNRKIKFQSLIRMADCIGAELIATGHYAEICLNQETGRYEIVAPADRKKDQGYMISRLSQEQLSRLLTPLAGIEDKAAVREIAKEAALHISEKKDSQEICFVDRTYLEILQHLGVKGKKGNFILDGEPVREHSGMELYTVGQRKGLGAFGRPVFVVKMDSESGDIVLGDNGDLFSRDIVFADVNYVALPEGAEIGECTAKIRYAAQKERCVIERCGEGRCGEEKFGEERDVAEKYAEGKYAEGSFVAHFENPQRAATPGQIIVFYDGDRILASGVISHVRDERRKD